MKHWAQPALLPTKISWNSWTKSPPFALQNFGLDTDGRGDLIEMYTIVDNLSTLIANLSWERSIIHTN